MIKRASSPVYCLYFLRVVFFFVFFVVFFLAKPSTVRTQFFELFKRKCSGLACALPLPEYACFYNAMVQLNRPIIQNQLTGSESVNRSVQYGTLWVNTIILIPSLKMHWSILSYHYSIIGELLHYLPRHVIVHRQELLRSHYKYSCKYYKITFPGRLRIANVHLET